MTDELPAGPRARGASAPHSDALVVFGFTGDLANKQIFPALYAMVKKGTLTVPVIGVASSSLSTGADAATRARQRRAREQDRRSGGASTSCSRC